MSSQLNQTTRENRISRTSSESIANLIQLNNMEYVLPRPISVVTNRRLIKHPSALSGANGVGSNSSLTMYLNSGDDYISGKTSYVKFDVDFAVSAGNRCDFGSRGSAVNLFSSVSYFHSSGSQMLNHSGFNTFENSKLFNMNSPDDLNNTMAVRGYSEASENYVGETQTFIIPLGVLCPIFNSSKYIPSYLASGSRLVLNTEAYATALRTENEGQEAQYNIVKAELVLDSITLSDEAISFLEETSASSGLSVVYNAYQHYKRSSVTGGSLQMDLPKAVSQATSAMIMIRNQGNLASDHLDSFLPVSVIQSIQWRLGSLLYPTYVEMCKESMYQQNQNYFKDYVKTNANTLQRYLVDEQGIAVMPLERDHLLRLSGHSTSGSRSVNVDASIDTGTFAIDGYLNYVKIARCFLFDRVLNME